MRPAAGSVLTELDVLDVLTAARTIQGETVADNLDDLGAHKLGELVGRLTTGEQAAGDGEALRVSRAIRHDG